MDAALVLQLAVGAAAFDRRDDLLQAAHPRIAARHHLDPPALTLGEFGVHPEQLARKQRRLVAAGASPDFEDDVLRVVGIFRDQQYLQLGDQAVAARDESLQLFPGEVAHVAVATGGELLGLGDVVHDRLVLAETLDHRLELGQRFGMLPVLRRVALHLGGAEPTHQILIALFFRCQLVEHDLAILNAELAEFAEKTVFSACSARSAFLILLRPAAEMRFRRRRR